MVQIPIMSADSGSRVIPDPAQHHVMILYLKRSTGIGEDDHTKHLYNISDGMSS